MSAEYEKKRRKRPAAYEQKRRDMRRATNTTMMVRNYAPNEPMRKACPIQCKECCDQPWRRVDELCRPGPCFRCGMPFGEEQRLA
jgi:hypothetical protein